ncbi:MAG TPA: FadR/GntR family transcriptional regulator [Symbiobacteriaceae bacterium]|jgi:GntR family transcriptional regulator, transcriptional repressor for pyruvate dehydrogenase complex|nr:FadR/GntR family transcriptional regulator [Symbiobacteriaceae bacterium]
MAIQPVKRTRAYEDIVRQLADMVRRGELQPGDRLPSERDLATAFGVGRPTLRQALTVLTQAGVVEVLPGSGIYLRKSVPEAPGEATSQAMALFLMTEQQNLHDIIELRAAIEGEAAYLAALRRTPEQAQKILDAFSHLCEAYDTRGVAAEEDYQFHFLVAEATHNPVLLKVMASLADLNRQQLVATTLSLYHEPDRISALRREHEGITKAIVEQRADDARAAMVKHLRRVSERLTRAKEKMEASKGPAVPTAMSPVAPTE